MRRNRALAATTLGVGLAVSVAVGIALIPEHPQSLIFLDELHYAQAARDIAAGSPPRFNRHFAPLPPPLYGATLAPAHWIGGDFDGFAWWSRVVNVLLYASILIPAYRLARIGAGRAASVAAAFLALLTTAVIYVPFLMAENLVVPLVLWCGVAGVACARRPTATRAGAAGVLLGLAGLTKTVALGLLPAMLLVAIGRRVFSRRGMGHAVALIAGATLVVLPWRARAAIFGSDASGPVLFDYADEIARAATHSIADYAYWSTVHLGATVVSVSPLIAALAVVGALRMLEDSRPGRRALGTWILGASALLILAAGFFVTNIAWWKPIVHARYLVPLWPLAMIGAVVALARPPRRRSIAMIGVAAVGVIIIAMPAATFASGAPRHYDYPSGASDTLALGFGIADGPARWIGLGILALAPLALWRPRAIGVVVMVAAGAFHVHRAVDLIGTTEQHQTFMRAPTRRAVAWLRGHVRPQDVLIQQDRADDAPCRIALALETDLVKTDRLLAPVFGTPFRVDPETGRVTFPKPGPGGRVLLFGPLRWLRADHVLGQHRNDVLYDISDGIRAAMRPDPVLRGIDDRRRVRSQAALVIPLPKPGRYRIELRLRSREGAPRPVEIDAIDAWGKRRATVPPDRELRWSHTARLRGWVLRLAIRVPSATTEYPLQLDGFTITPLDG